MTLGCAPLTIVQVAPSLGIGGVETYLYRLSLGLVERGHRIILVVREPGAYAERATATGAELLVVPFEGAGMETAVSRLATAGVDLVHAHNYRAARFGRRLSQALGTRYLMSVHGPRPWYKRLLFRDWSPTVVAMSEADRENIVGHWGVRWERIELSFYGIDTGRFGPHVDGAGFRAELGLGEGPLIVHVSRFSHRKAEPALALVEALGEVRRHFPGAVLALVGKGPGARRIEARARALGLLDGPGGGERGALRLVGRRTDIPEIMAAADAVVATANTALEAIATGTGTIAFGRAGYGGIVDRKGFEQARAHCFADHGRLSRLEHPARLAGDLVTLLGRDPSEAAGLARLMARDYHLGRMAEQVEAIYRRTVDGR